MPPEDPIGPPVGDVMPYPDEILPLGGNRWLDITGAVLLEPFGVETDLKPNTLAFWEAAAVRGTGKPLYELIDPPS